MGIGDVATLLVFMAISAEVARLQGPRDGIDRATKPNLLTKLVQPFRC